MFEYLMKPMDSLCSGEIHTQVSGGVPGKYPNI